jgi:hypothetical protein
MNKQKQTENKSGKLRQAAELLLNKKRKVQKRLHPNRYFKTHSRA